MFYVTLAAFMLSASLCNAAAAALPALRLTPDR
jgi:hypothetical protein